MPPRKRARVAASVAASSTRNRKTVSASPPKAASVASGNESEHESPKPTNPTVDLWTDDEEIQLLKSIMQYKPTGVNAHMRMIRISEDLTSHGYTAEHTRIPNIWAKLETMYDLESLNEREDRHAGLVPESSDEENEEEGSEDGEPDRTDFDVLMPRIQDDEFTDPRKPGFDKCLGEMMWERRFKKSKDTRDGGEDVKMTDADEDESELVEMSSPEAIEDLRTTRSGLDLELPSRAEADAAYAAEVAAGEKRASGRGRGRRGRGGRGRGRATRATPVQETEEEDEDDSDDDDDDESTAAGSPPAGRGVRGGRRGRGPGRGRGRYKK